MTEPKPITAFSSNERAALHSLAEMFQDKDDRDQLRQLMHDGATLKEIILAFRTQRRMISSLKAVGGLIVLLGAAVAALKAMSMWPK